MICSEACHSIIEEQHNPIPLGKLKKKNFNPIQFARKHEKIQSKKKIHINKWSVDHSTDGTWFDSRIFHNWGGKHIILWLFRFFQTFARLTFPRKVTDQDCERHLHVFPFETRPRGFVKCRVFFSWHLQILFTNFTVLWVNRCIMHWERGIKKRRILEPKKNVLVWSSETRCGICEGRGRISWLLMTPVYDQAWSWKITWGQKRKKARVVG